MLATLEVSALQIPESILAILPPKAYGESKTRESVYGRTGLTFDAMALPEVSANHTLKLLFNSQRLNRISQQGARSPSAFSLDDLLSQTYDHVFNNKEQRAMGKKLAQRVQFLTAKKLADLSISDQVDPEVQAQLRFYLTQLVGDYTQSGLFNDVSKGESAFRQFLSEQVQYFLVSGQWPVNYKAIKTPPGSPI